MFQPAFEVIIWRSFLNKLYEIKLKLYVWQCTDKTMYNRCYW